MGYERYMQKKEARAQKKEQRAEKKKAAETAAWKSQIREMSKNHKQQENHKRYDGGTALGQEVKGASRGNVENLHSSLIQRVGKALDTDTIKPASQG